MHHGYAAIRGTALTFAHHALYVCALQHGLFSAEPVLGLAVLLVKSLGNPSLTPLPLHPPGRLTTRTVLARSGCGT